MEDEYVPFGVDWEREVMKMTKPELVDFLKKALIDNQELKVAVEELEKQTKTPS